MDSNRKESGKGWKERSSLERVARTKGGMAGEEGEQLLRSIRRSDKKEKGGGSSLEEEGKLGRGTK